MKTPEVVVFDLGKVLVDFDYDIAVRMIATRCPGGECDVRSLLHETSLLLRYETGLISTAQFFAEARTATGFSWDEAEFAKLFADIFSPIQPMIDLHATLREKGVPTYIFSNTNELAIRHINDRFPFFRTFTGYVLSYEQRSMKPDAKIYESVEKLTGTKGNQIVYLDDRRENIEAGALRNWHTILHEDPAASRAGLQQLGIV